LNFGAIKEEMEKLSNTYNKARGTLQREVPRSVPGKGAPTASPTRTGLTDLQSRRVQMYLSELKSLESTVLQHADKVHTIVRDPDSIMKWIKDKKYNILNPASKNKYIPSGEDISKIRNFVKTLQTKLARTASLKVEAQGSAIPSGVFKDDPKAVVKTPGVKRPGVGRVSKEDPQVKKLQQAMMAAGIPLTKFKDDGKWGGETMQGWEKLRSMVPRAGLSAATKDYNSLKPQFDRATRFAYALAKTVKQQDVKFQVDGKEFNSGDFADLTSALTAMDRNYGFNRDEMHDNEYVKAVWMAFVNIYKKLSGEEGAFIENYHGPQMLSALKASIVSLLKQIRDRGLPQKGKVEEVPGIPGVSSPEKPATPGGIGYQRRTDWKPGSKDGGIKGLQYPVQLNTMDDLKLAIAYLPSGFILSTPQNFMTYAYSVFRRKGAPAKKPKTYQEAAKLYFGMLRSRVADILAAMGDLSGEMRATQPGLLRDMEEDTLLFNRALMTIGEKLGLV